MFDKLETTDDEPDTDELLGLAADGSQSAEHQLLERHRQRLKRMVDARIDCRVARRVDPSDVVQEVLFEASRTISTYIDQRPVAFYPWLRQIALNRLVDMHRMHVLSAKRSVKRETVAANNSTAASLAHWISAFVSPTPTPIDDLIHAEMKQRVTSALESLSEMDREILLLRHIEQRSVSEVAELLGIASGTVKSRHFRAIEHLRKQLERDT